MAKIQILPLCTRHSCTTLRVKNSLEIALSLTVFEILVIHTFSFTAKIQDGHQKWRKSKFYPFEQDTLVLPCGSKIRSKSLYLLWFLRYSHFFIFRKNPRWRPKVSKIEIFRLCIGHSCTTLRVKTSLEIALSVTVIEIFILFHLPQTSNMAVKSGEKRIFDFPQDTLVLPCGSKIRSKSLCYGFRDIHTFSFSAKI